MEVKEDTKASWLPFVFLSLADVAFHLANGHPWGNYPGLESIVDELLDNNIEFSFDGDVDLLDHDGVVIATAGLLLDNYKIAIDPFDEDSRQIFERAGYQVVSSDEFSIDILKE